MGGSKFCRAGKRPIILSVGQLLDGEIFLAKVLPTFTKKLLNSFAMSERLENVDLPSVNWDGNFAGAFFLFNSSLIIFHVFLCC